MFPALIEFSKNYVVFSAALAWLFTQTLKVVLGIIIQRRFDFMWFVGTGGMPSSHAAGVTALTTSIGLYAGFDAPVFGMALFFTIVVLFDAQGVRRSSGEQAKVLNKILDDIYWRRKIQGNPIKELLGHTPVEIFCGVAIGIFISLLCYRGV
jgi:acid phosphatase family membrane protein YuiD